MKNFFETSVHQALFERLQHLKADSKPKWGILTPAQMLKHLRLENDLALGNYTGKDYSNIAREWTFKQVTKGNMPLPNFLSKLRLIPAIPELYVIKSKVKVEDFDTEKSRLMAQFQALVHTKNFANLHPRIRRMNATDWGFFYTWHTDYHLRQFDI